VKACDIWLFELGLSHSIGSPVLSIVLQMTILFFYIFYYYDRCKWHLQKFLQCIIVEFTPSIVLFFPSSPNSWKFQHLHTHVHNIGTIFSLLYPVPKSSPLPVVPNSWAGSVLLSCSTFL
jgi:hypothetical protein